jgi:short-subunit dehydrogenase
MMPEDNIFDFKVLKGKRAFVSGATGGIGGSIASALAKQGCDLFLTGRDENKLSKLTEELSLQDIHISFAAGNLSEANDVHNIESQAKKVFNSIDIVINAAGVFPNSNLFDIKDDDYIDAMNINFRSAFIFTREFAKGMVKRKWGRIVNIGSSSSYNGFGGTSLYCASKHALLGFSRSIHNELKQHNVRTFCVSPSSTQSKIGLETEGQDYSTFIDPNDIARYVVFVISFDSNIVSDEILLKRMVLE